MKTSPIFLLWTCCIFLVHHPHHAQAANDNRLIKKDQPPHHALANDTLLKKLCFEHSLQPFTVQAKKGERFLLEFKTQTEGSKQCAYISTEWPGLEDFDLISFENENGDVLGKAFVKLLRDVGANATALEFPSGILRCYIIIRTTGAVKAACPVLSGFKWVANKWLHERGQEFIRQCPLKMAQQIDEN
ncbi:hypothetical protein niasHT_014305 [Heterodera trifolii]|uniref:Uncharacterized protein n=1 Tax=Heterodera trifolii TaxID=157864 RepID=A0ABD2L874_9BILA